MVNLSIIIPHYNSTNSLFHLLDTIPNSEHIEILVVDDHSNIMHKKKISTFKNNNSHRNIDFLTNDIGKKGAGSCRNIGLNRANGNWILFADADDYFLNDFFDIIQKYFNSENDVIFFKPISIEIETGETSDRHLPYVELLDNYLENQSFESEARLRYFFLVPWSKLININLIRKNAICFDEVIASNDVMFSAKAGFYMKKFEVAEEVIYCVTRSKGSLTTTNSHQIFDSRLNVFIDYYNFLKEHCLSKKDFKIFKLNLSGRFMLIKSFTFGYRKTFSVYKKLRESKVHIIDLKYLNPVFLINKSLFFYRKYKKQQKKNTQKNCG